MPRPDPSPLSPSFLGVLTGFACVFLLFSRREKKPKLDDAEVLLQIATQEMKEAQARNRERAVQVITQKNHLQALVDQAQKTVSRLDGQAETARKEGHRKRERQILAERGKAKKTLTRLQESLQAAAVTAEATKTAMRREESHIQILTAQALAMRASAKQAQIEREIERSRLAMTASPIAELFTRAQAKIQQAQARNRLMAQIRETVEVLEAAADASDDAALRQRLLDGRDRLRERALDPRLGL